MIGKSFLIARKHTYSYTHTQYIYIYIYIYIYCVIHRKTRRTLEAGVETNFTLDLVSDRSANKCTTSAREL